MASTSEQYAGPAKPLAAYPPGTITIHPKAELAWINALADIGRSIRAAKGIATHIIQMGEDQAAAHPSGALVLTTTIDGEKVEMHVPPGQWQENPQQS